MIDSVREELATLGQRIVMAEADRSDALDRIREIVQKSGSPTNLAAMSQLTTLSQEELSKMLSDDA